MNREILFRGKRKGNGKWIEGCLLQYSDGDEFICCESYISDALDKYAIAPETVGQFTGLADKNGTKIFEGDIIKYKGELLEVRYGDNMARFLTVFLTGIYVPNPTIIMTKGRVIGNVHDNPELLGGAE